MAPSVSPSLLTEISEVNAERLLLEGCPSPLHFASSTGEPLEGLPVLPAPSKQGWGQGQDLTQLLAGTVCSPKLQQDRPEELPLRQC